MTITFTLNGGAYYEYRGEKMFRLRVESQFDAAHKLIGYKGKCSRLHGHSWKVEAFVVGEKLDDIGILVDYKMLKEKLGEISEKLDHGFLNDLKEIGTPTSENLSRYLFHNLKGLPETVRLEKVRVWESTKSWCEYSEQS